MRGVNLHPIFAANQVFHLYCQTAFMLAEASMVITMRVMGMNGLWRVAPSEDHRMIREKFKAGNRAGQAMGRAASRGGTPATIAMAGLKPVRLKTRANVKRLAKRGPGPKPQRI